MSDGPTYRPPYRPDGARDPLPPLPPTPPKRRRPTPRELLTLKLPGGWLVGILLGVLALLILATAGFALVNNNRFCGTCHVIKKEVVSFDASSHHKEGVGCQDCHTKPGVFNYFIRNLQSATHIIEYISGRYQRPIVTYVGAENCVTCHPKSQIEQDIIVGNIRVNHKGLREAGYQCVTCHADVVHGDTTPIGSRAQSKMSICVRCHNGVTQPRRCSICHLNGVPAGAANVQIPVHMNAGDCTQCHSNKVLCSRCHNGVPMPHPADWLPAAHGRYVLDSGAQVCAKCHTAKDPEFCIGCHKLPMPHPAGWQAQHGPFVLGKGAKLCATCHTKDDPSFCIRCHGVQMPHPAGWQAVHGQVAERDFAVCSRCHTAAQCTSCHGIVMPHPAGFAAGGVHGSLAASNPSLCAKCHSQSFCVACHGVVLPHPSSFIASHFTYAAREGYVCVKCHGNTDSGSRGCYGGDCHKKANGTPGN